MGKLSVSNLQAAGVQGGDLLVQTGTGSKHKHLAQVAELFNELVSIDLDPNKCRSAEEHLKGLRNVTILCGCSAKVLPTIIDRTRDTVFFLDAHAEVGDGSSDPCPLLEELEAIYSEPWEKDPKVLIDDARLFMNRFWTTGNGLGHSREGWPTFQQIWDVARAHGLGVVHVLDMLALERA